MSNPNERTFQDFNQQMIAEFRANGGKVSGQFANANMLLLTTTGAKSGKEHTNPLVYFTDGDCIVIIASKGGAPTNPDWYYNLVAHPQVTVELGSERFQAHAVVAGATERERIFAEIAQHNAGFARYQQQTSRKIPIVLLERGTQ